MKMSLSDRVALQVNPKGFAQRIAARLRAQQLLEIAADGGSSSTVPQRSETRWRGASQVLRSLAGWITTLGSGRSDTPRYERERMAARSYDAYRNHLIARAAVTRKRTNVVGTGLQMTPSVDAEALGISEEEAEKLNDAIAREWRLYYNNPSEVDIEATHDGAGLQSLALITASLGGDCWASTPFEEAPGGIYGLKIQLIDPARVSNVNNQPDTPTLQDGVEISLTGRPIAIQVRNRHPADNFVKVRDGWTRHEIFAPDGKRRIFQIWNDKDRIGITRGVPMLAPILEPLQTLEQYSRAELIAAVVSAMFTVFIEKDAQQFDERGEPVAPLAGSEQKGEDYLLQLGNGAVVDLNPGEKAHDTNPGRPNANYDPFFLSIVRQIGAALEIPLDELLLNYQASYSAARAAMLQAWRFYTTCRWWLVQQFCHPHYCLWFDEAVARGRLQGVSNYADPTRRAAYTQAIWTGPARGAMQEKNEVDAAKARIDSGLSNETIETAQMMGEDWRMVYKTRLRETKQRKADGMELGPAPGQQAAQQGAGENPKPKPGQADPTDPRAPRDREDVPVEEEEET